MNVSGNIVCCVSLLNRIGWQSGAEDGDQSMFESLVAVYGIWERTCYRHGGIRKTFTTSRPAGLKDCSELIPN